MVQPIVDHSSGRTKPSTPFFRPALLRLEDVGPGGSYRTRDDLGRLRAVFEYLFSRQVPFHVALIPRWKNIKPDGTWYEKGIDDPDPDEYVRLFIHLMQSVEQQGTLIGMHGYTHQYGNRKRADDNQDSGTGSEFNVEGVPETATASYALERFGLSLAAFEKAQLYPAFWESPHYNDTKEQEDIFESLISVLYQPDVGLHADAGLYVAPTGTVYIPTPLDYIHETNTVDQVLAKLPHLRQLASLFYHPYLEFSLLEPATNTSGHPLDKNGLPVYRYKKGAPSDLHRLIDGFREQGYQWVSFTDILPFRLPHRSFCGQHL